MHACHGLLHCVREYVSLVQTSSSKIVTSCTAAGHEIEEVMVLDGKYHELI
jgi:hypothetical protein